ncbi:MAG: tetratricopeptide repeat protein [Caldilineales bacterium]|nr:tetratricopeptide repeat protein [Caldilineales bacterium]MDW8318024.1 tetratricopeptide repeat protein [Anaerolineae bacterium]
MTARRQQVPWLLALALLLALTAAPTARAGRAAAAGRPLLHALLWRAELGDLPLGPGTPALWALARSTGDLASPSPSPRATTRRLQIRQALEQADQRLTALGYRPRLAGIAAGTRGRYAEAQAHLEAAHRSRPRDIFALVALGNVLDAQGDRAAAVAAWRSVSALRPLAAQLHRWGAQLAQAGARSRAEAALALAVAVDPAFGDGYYALGGFYWGLDGARAAEMYRAALAAGGLTPYQERMAQAKLALLEDRPADAIAPLEEASQLRPEDPEAVEFLGSALRRLGRSDEAIAFFARAAQLNPASPWPLVQLGQVHLQLGNYPEAITALRQALARRTDLPLAFDLLARAYLAEGQAQQAAAAWRQAIALRPDTAAYFVGLGDALRAAGNPAEAVAAYEAALRLDPDNLQAVRGLRAAAGQP